MGPNGWGKFRVLTNYKDINISQRFYLVTASTRTCSGYFTQSRTGQELDDRYDAVKRTSFENLKIIFYLRRWASCSAIQCYTVPGQLTRQTQSSPVQSGTFSDQDPLVGLAPLSSALSGEKLVTAFVSISTLTTREQRGRSTQLEMIHNFPIQSNHL